MRIWSPERSEATEITETEITETEAAEGTGRDQHGDAETRRLFMARRKPRRDNDPHPWRSIGSPAVFM
jgi:hypothetical protein